jgi:hypothetical protein
LLYSIRYFANRAILIVAQTRLNVVLIRNHGADRERPVSRMPIRSDKRGGRIVPIAPHEVPKKYGQVNGRNQLRRRGKICASLEATIIPRRSGSS